VDSEPRYELRIDMSSKQATALLERVASDDAFRSELESNPEEALAQYGISAKGLEGRVSLPSPDEVRRFQDLASSASPGTAQGLPFMPCLMWAVLAYAGVASGTPTEQAK
jgi:putative modified peptide